METLQSSWQLHGPCVWHAKQKYQTTILEILGTMLTHPIPKLRKDGIVNVNIFGPQVCFLLEQGAAHATRKGLRFVLLRKLGQWNLFTVNLVKSLVILSHSMHARESIAVNLEKKYFVFCPSQKKLSEDISGIYSKLLSCEDKTWPTM